MKKSRFTEEQIVFAQKQAELDVIDKDWICYHFVLSESMPIIHTLIY